MQRAGLRVCCRHTPGQGLLPHCRADVTDESAADVVNDSAPQASQPTSPAGQRRSRRRRTAIVQGRTRDWCQRTPSGVLQGGTAWVPPDLVGHHALIRRCVVVKIPSLSRRSEPAPTRDENLDGRIDGRDTPVATGTARWCSVAGQTTASATARWSPTGTPTRRRTAMLPCPPSRPPGPGGPARPNGGPPSGPPWPAPPSPARWRATHGPARPMDSDARPGTDPTTGRTAERDDRPRRLHPAARPDGPGRDRPPGRPDPGPHRAGSRRWCAARSRGPACSPPSA